MTPTAIDYQIMWNRLIAVVEEQATTLIRTAFSTSCLLYTSPSPRDRG